MEHERNPRNVTTAYTYDSNSNMQTVTTGGEGWSFKQPGTGTEEEVTFEISAYDVFTRLISVQNDNYIARYKYNADGLRTSKTVTQGETTTSTKFLYESGEVTLELDDAGAQTAYNVYGNGSIISRKTAQGTDYYIYNGRGDVVQLTNTWGAVTVTYDYDAFGNLLDAQVGDTNPFRYCGEYWDF